MILNHPDRGEWKLFKLPISSYRSLALAEGYKNVLNRCVYTVLVCFASSFYFVVRDDLLFRLFY